MTRQNAALVLVDGSSTSRLEPIPLKPLQGGSAYDEAWIQNLIFAQPMAMPVGEIAPGFGPLIPICKELDTRSAGYADALFINPLGMPTLVECKLWRNPQARREVVGQINDYARVLRSWSYVDLQRQVAQARKEQGFDLAHYVGGRSNDPDFSESVFCDNVGRNLKRGHILLLIVGDGIREGVEAIANYIQETAALHFVLGLIEVAVYKLDETRYIVQPRILAKTSIIERNGAEGVPSVENALLESAAAEPSPATVVENNPKLPLDERQIWMGGFWSELLASLKLDDADQAIAKVAPDSTIFFYLKPQMWVTCYFSAGKREIGVFLGMYKNSVEAMSVADALENDAEAVKEDSDAAGVEVNMYRRGDGKLMISTTRNYAVLRDENVRADQLAWFQQTINIFINVLRPRILQFWGKTM